jgi:hypothetical protein
MHSQEGIGMKKGKHPEEQIIRLFQEAELKMVVLKSSIKKMV